MLVGPVVAKIQARCECHMLGFQEMRTEPLCILGKRTHIAVQIKRTLRLHINAEAQLAQGRQQIIPALPELLTALLENRNCLRLETRQRRMLGHARGTDVEVLCQLFQLRHRIDRRHQPAQAPAGHAEILGEAVEHEGIVIDLQHAGGVAAVGQAVIDLVHHQMPATGFQRTGQFGQLVPAKHRTGGVGGRCDQGADAITVPVSLDQVGIELIAHLRAHRHQLRGALDQPQKVPIAGIAGVRQQPMLARIDQQAAGQQQGAGTAGSNQHAFGVNRSLIALLVEPRDRLPEPRQPSGRGVARVSGGQCGLSGDDDGRSGGEVRFAYFQVNDVTSQRLQFIGSRQQRHDVKGFDCATTSAIRRGHLTFPMSTKREFYRRSLSHRSHRPIEE